MAEINKSDLITDEATNAPLQLADNFDKVVMAVERVTAATKKLESSMSDVQTMAKTKQDTDALGSSLAELDKIQGQFAKSTQKLSDEYVNTKRALDDVNKASKDAVQAAKDRVTLDNQEAKSIDAKNASLKQLQTALSINRKLYADLAGDVERNSKAGTELLKVIQSQDEAVKKLNGSIGIHKDNVGGYKQAIESLLPSLKALSPEFVEAGEKSTHFVSTFVTNITQLGIAYQGLNKESDKSASTGFFANIKSFFTGSVIATILGVAGAFEILKHSVETYIEDTAEGAGRAKIFSANWKAATEIAREGFVSLGKTIFDIITPENTEKIDSMSKSILGFIDPRLVPLVDIFRNKVKEQIAVFEDLRDERGKAIELIVKGAELELEKNRALYEAREKLANSDKVRYKSVQEAEDAIIKKEELEMEVAQLRIKAIKDEFTFKGLVVGADQKAIDLLHDKHALSKITKDDIKELAEAEAKLFEIENERFSGARRRQALRIQIINDVLKKQTDADKTIRESEKLNSDTAQQAIINDNKLRIGNQEFTLTEQLAALKDNLDAQKQINETDRDRELADAKLQAVERVQITGDTFDNIKDKAKGNVEVLAKLYKEEKNKRAETDVAYLAQVGAINAKYVEIQVQAEREAGKGVAAVITDNEKYFQDIRDRINKEQYGEQLDKLREQYNSGNVNIVAYEKQRNILINSSKQQGLKIQTESAKSELEELQKQFANEKTLTKEQYDALLAANKKYIDAKKQQEDDADATAIAKEKKIHEMRMQLQSQLFATALGVGNNIIASEIQDSQVRINNLESDKQRELDIHKDNKEETARINKKYSDLEAAETKKQLELRRRQAEFDKAIAAVEIAVRTAEAVAAAFLTPWEIPFILAMGAAQEALVLSKPIPAYEKGTKSAKGGFSLVGEKGMELVQSPSGKLALTPNSSSIMNLEKGSQVFTHEDTIKMLAMSSMGNERYVDGQNAMLHSQLSALNETTKSNGKEITKAIENMNGKLYQQGTLLYRLQESADGNRRMLRLKALGK